MKKRSSKTHPKAPVQGGHWPRRAFADFADFKNGLNYAAEDVGTGVKIVGVSNFWDAFSIDFRDLPRVQLPDSTDESYFLRNGDLLFVRSNGNKALIGRVLLVQDVREPIAHSGFTIRARLRSSELLPAFAAYFFTSPLVKEQFHRLGSGTNISNLSQAVLESVVLPVPSLDEQRQIIRVLDAWRHSINTLTRLIKFARRRRRGLMQQMLTGRHRFPEFAGEPWREVQIGDVLREVNRTVKLKADETYRLVSVRRRSGGFFDREVRTGKDIGYRTLEQLHAGDFVIARRQVLHGAMATVAPEFDGAYVSNAYAILVPHDPARFHLPFFNFMSQLSRLYHMAYRCSYGVAIEKMFFRLDWFLRECIEVPPTIEEQRKIAAVLTVADREIDLMEQQLAALKQQKKGLMQKLLSGHVRLPEFQTEGVSA